MTFLGKITGNKDGLNKENVEKQKKMNFKRMTHDPSLRKECSLSPVELPKSVVEISSCGQEETPSNPFLLI